MNRLTKTMCATIALAVGLPVLAESEGYEYLTFEKQDGSLVSYLASSLTINVEGGNLSVTSREGNSNIVAADLTKMYFSTASSEMTQLKDVIVGTEAVEVYTTGGVYMGRYNNLNELRNTLPKGVYIVKSGSINFKYAVK